jgi:hypothetical protein
MNTRIRYTACLLLALSIAIALLLALPEVNRSRAKARASGPIASSASRVGGMEDDLKETTFTPPPAGLKTWVVSHEWHNDRWNCPTFWGGAHAGGLKSDVPAGQVLAGYINSYDGGSGPLPCESNSKDIFQGTIWFDLSEIFSKPPFPFATEATLKFKKVAGSVAAYDGNRKPITKVCEDRLFISNGDSMKGFPEGTLVPEDDLLQAINECPAEGCSVNVKDLVNNWITGKIDRYGFVIAGEDEGWLDKLIPFDNSVCETRYSDFSLTVKYKFKKSLVIIPLPPEKKTTGRGRDFPDSLPVGKNVALASNGGKVFPSSTLPPFSENYVNDGELTGAGNAVWLDNTLGVFPDDIEVRFDGTKTIEEIDVITRQDNLITPVDPKVVDPDFENFGITVFDVQYWDGSAWSTVASVGRGKFGPSENTKVWRRFTGFKVTTDRIRIHIKAAKDNAYSRVVEVEAWGK